MENNAKNNVQLSNEKNRLKFSWKAAKAEARRINKEKKGGLSAIMLGIVLGSMSVSNLAVLLFLLLGASDAFVVGFLVTVNTTALALAVAIPIVFAHACLEEKHKEELQKLAEANS